MSNKDLADLKLESLPRLSITELQPLAVSAALLALGSNYQADHHLPYVQNILAELGEIELSNAVKNPDITATKEQPKPDYINQSVYLALSKSMTLAQLQQVFKNLEDECGRERTQKSKSSGSQGAVTKVSMDIDILLVKINHKKNSLSKFENKWTVIAERLPFADHEMTGIKELQKKS
ncbi:2-amino-4-hydroxy-6-hydroxymethyldihydropteridine diphosphokinase [Psychrobacter sp. 1U2]|uniref:2-amino-4-hydroxy-6- hydroxymethyldihydropteridine diphosphokinase n=1 Tax=Psychrobacter sp. 1U2 TaxID=3453577 RepID=UPI003F48FABC